MLEGRFDHLLDALLINRQAHTAAEVRQLRTMTRAAVLRFPATVEMAPVCAQLLAIADGPALAQELRLAMIEESGDISDAAWQAVSNAAHSLPCVRAGRLYMALQAVRLPADSMLDWSGWVAALDAAAGECAPHAPTGVRVGGIELARKALMRPLFLYAARLPARDADAVQAALCRSIRALNTTDFNRVVELFEGRGNTNAVIELHAARVGSFATPSPPDPSFKALVALEPTMTSAQRSWCAGLMASLARRETDAGRRSDWEAYHAMFQARE
jgi:hypothetical protein